MIEFATGAEDTLAEATSERGGQQYTQHTHNEDKSRSTWGKIL